MRILAHQLALDSALATRVAPRHVESGDNEYPIYFQPAVIDFKQGSVLLMPPMIFNVPRDVLFQCA